MLLLVLAPASYSASGIGFPEMSAAGPAAAQEPARHPNSTGSFSVMSNLSQSNFERHWYESDLVGGTEGRTDVATEGGKIAAPGHCAMRCGVALWWRLRYDHPAPRVDWFWLKLLPALRLQRWPIHNSHDPCPPGTLHANMKPVFWDRTHKWIAYLIVVPNAFKK